MSFLAALQFLTVISLSWRRPATPKELGGAIAYFPLVGLIIGLILAGLNWLLNTVFPAALVNALLIAAMALLPGLLHLDGFVDTCDGLAGHRTVEERWRIMHDSRAGGFGVVSVVLLVLVQYASLSSVPPALMITTLVFMPVVSRWAMSYALFAYPYARPTGLGKVFKDGATWPKFTVATVIALVVAAALFPLIHFSGPVIMVGVWIITMAMAALFKNRFAGLTGDTYGAINEMAEVGVLVLVVLLARLGLA